ncbi:MAG: chromophore lyase CpcT/CpeT [Phormidesmis sp.]
MPSTPLTTLARYLAGEFENVAQAAAEPSWYVRLRLWQRPVLSLSDAHTYTLFLEQVNVIAQKPPYRQRILQLTEADGRLRGQYFALSQPLKWQGGGDNGTLLDEMSPEDLISLPNSEAHIQYQDQPQASGLASGYQFRSALPDGQLCSFEYAGQKRYVYLGFDIAQQGDAIELLTYDKGIDPDSGRGLWGALMGPFRMIKQKTYDW